MVDVLFPGEKLCRRIFCTWGSRKSGKCNLGGHTHTGKDRLYTFKKKQDLYLSHFHLCSLGVTTQFTCHLSRFGRYFRPTYGSRRHLNCVQVTTGAKGLAARPAEPVPPKSGAETRDLYKGIDFLCKHIKVPLVREGKFMVSFMLEKGGWYDRPCNPPRENNTHSACSLDG